MIWAAIRKVGKFPKTQKQNPKREEKKGEAKEVV